jgi:2-(3-amino-3-carboxypropyl)histidine synthase
MVVTKMKMHFIETKAKTDIVIPVSVIKKLPRKLSLAGSVQFSHKLPQLKKFLEKHGKKASLVKARHSKYVGQILGCGYSKLEYDKANTDAFLYIGDGMFHPEALLLGSDEKAVVYAFDPFTKELKKLDRAWSDRIKKKEKGGMLRFLHSTSIGVIITVKPGQMGAQVGLKKILELEKKFPDKKFYYLIADTIDFTQLENFSFVECFVNTACHRMVDDYDKFPKAVVNIEEVLKLS